jgi:ABC-type enterochelin transport system permease subunit
MITKLVIQIMQTAFHPLFAVLPTSDIASWFNNTVAGTAYTCASGAPHGGVNCMGFSAGGKLEMIDGFFPMHEMMTLMSTVVSTVVVAIGGYVFIQWVLRHIPHTGMSS